MNNRVKVGILAGLLLARAGLAQQKQPVSSLQEDCGVIFAFTTASSGAQAAGTTTAGSTGTTAVIDNTQAGCIDWLVTYSTTSTVATVSLAFQTADNVAGVPGTWGNYPGTLNSGINPNTAIGNGAVTDATGDKYPFLRMNMTAKTGAGTVSGKLYGWKRRPTYVSVTAGGGCVGTLATPCVVVGNKSNNAVVPGATNLGVLPALANAAAPTWTEGFQVVNSVDLNGNQRTMGPQASGATLTKNPFPIAGVNISGGIVPIVTDASGYISGYKLFTGADANPNQAAFPVTANTSPFVASMSVYPNWFNGTTWDRARGNTTGQFVQGVRTNNTAAPGTNNQGVLPCLANAVAPTWTEGNLVANSCDLAGAQRITGTVVITPSGTQNVNLFQVAGTGTVTGGVAGLLAIAGAAASGATKSGNPVQIGGVFNTTQPTVTNGQAVDAQFTARGGQIVANGVEAFTVQPGNTPNTTPWLTAPTTVATTANAALTSYTTSAASTNSTSVKGSAGNVYGISAINTTSTIYYLRMYNSSSAPTCSSATGFIESLPIPNAAGAGAGFVRMSVVSQGYTTGIGFCITGGGGSTDNTNAATGVYVTILYK